MRKVKKIQRTSMNYSIDLTNGDSFEFKLVYDDEWVLQGEESNDERGIRYSQDELQHIVKELQELNGVKKVKIVKPKKKKK